MTSGRDGDGPDQDVLVIADAAGNLYLIRRETLEAGRIFDELKERVEQLMGDQAPADPQGPFQVLRTIRVPAPSSPTRTIRETLRNL